MLPQSEFHLHPNWRSTRFAVLVVIITAGILFGSHARKCRAGEPFPSYPAIRNNVEFWEKIYETVSIHSAVIHDREDLSKIYAMVELRNEDLPGAAEANTLLLEHSQRKYETLLRRLAHGQQAVSPEEKRIIAMFSGPDIRNRLIRAAGNIRSQKGLKERFREGVVRSGAFMTAIRRIFAGYGLPLDLAYLPHVESSFNLNAHSKDGATGIWQFTRSTGKRYFRIDEAIDERLDPLIAAHGAARYLKNSYEALGSWPLAITSYNYGTAGMVRAQNAKGSYERIFREYNEGYFKFASRNFYSEFLAARRVAERIERNPAIRLDQPSPSRPYTITGFVHIKDIERHFNVSAETIGQLNPALRPAIFTGEKYLPKGYTLRLPDTGNTDQLAGPLPATVFKNDQKKSPVHKVKRGEAASTIARRYQISLKQLIQANNLDRRGTVFIGQKLTIPGKNTIRRATPTQTARTAAAKTLPPRRSVTTKKETLPDSFSQKRPTSSNTTERDFFSAFTVVDFKKYTVLAGDTVWHICHNKFAIPVWLLKKYNTHLDLTDLKAAQELSIPVIKAI